MYSGGGTSWEQKVWEPHDKVVPDIVKLFVDDKEVSSAQVKYETEVAEVYEPLTKEVWAAFPGTKEPATLEALIAVAEPDADGVATITLTEDVTWTTGAGHGSTPLLTADSTIRELVIEGEYHTLTAEGQGVGSLRAANGGTLVFKNLNIVDESVSYAEGSWESTYLEFAGNLEFDNCTFNSGISLDLDNDQAEGVAAKFTGYTFISPNANRFRQLPSLRRCKPCRRSSFN